MFKTDDEHLNGYANDFLALNRFDDANPVCRVDNLIIDLEILFRRFGFSGYFCRLFCN